MTRLVEPEIADFETFDAQRARALADSPQYFGIRTKMAVRRIILQRVLRDRIGRRAVQLRQQAQGVAQRRCAPGGVVVATQQHLAQIRTGQSGINDAAAIPSQRRAGMFAEAMQQLHVVVFAPGIVDACAIEPVTGRIVAAAKQLVEAVPGTGHPRLLARRKRERTDPSRVFSGMDCHARGGRRIHAATTSRNGSRWRPASASHAWNINTSHSRAPSSAWPETWRSRSCLTCPGSK